MYVCMYVCMCVCVYIYIYIYIYIGCTCSVYFLYNVCGTNILIIIEIIGFKNVRVIRYMGWCVAIFNAFSQSELTV
jgi:hypothetical protein